MNHSVFLRFPNGRSKALTLSYDDGVVEDIRLIELMNRYGLKGTFNINSSHFLEADYKPRTDRAYGRRLSREEAIELYQNSGQEIALHAHTHPFLETLPPAQVAYEVMKNREALEGMFGGIIDGMAYPYGTTSDAVVEVLKSCGVLYSRTTVSTHKFDLPTDWLRMPATCHHRNPELMDLADLFLKKEIKWHSQLFYLWGHSYEFERDGNWEVIEDFAKKMGGRNNVWYATNKEIYQYVESGRALKFSADMRTVYNPTAMDVWFEMDNTLYRVAAGETLRLAE